MQIQKLAEEVARKQKEAESIEREMELKEKLNIERDKEMRKQLSESQQTFVANAIREAVELAKEEEAKKQLEIELRAKEAEEKLR